MKWGDASLKVVFYEPRGFMLKAGPFGDERRTSEFTLTTPGGVELRRGIDRRSGTSWSGRCRCWTWR